MALKKGLLIGINYVGTTSELSGCINDTENLKQLLLKNRYFDVTQLTFMSDKQSGLLYPSKENILTQLNNLVTFCNNNQSKSIFLFVAYSGHGSTVRDTNGDESDHQDEVLCPADYSTNGYIVDDYLKKSFINQLGSNVTLVILIDACHSGTVLDLKYNYTCDVKNRYTTQGVESDTKCQIVMISGCTDVQTSADAYLPDNVTKVKEYQGAMTASFITNYDPAITVKDLVLKMQKWLKSNKYTQVPQVSSGQLINVSTYLMFGAITNHRETYFDMIKNITYGKNAKFVDVTMTIRTAFEKGKTPIKLTNNLFGDPCHGVIKELRVNYTNGQFKTFRENSQITLNNLKL
jgi:metacaspase-1